MDHFKTRRIDIAFVLLILVSLAAIVNIVVLTSQYSSGSSEQAIRAAEVYALDTQEKFESKIDSIREKTEAIASVAGVMEEGDLHRFLNDILVSSEYRNEVTILRYFFEENEYTQSGHKMDATQESPYVLNMRKGQTTATYGLIYDERGTSPSIACYCPIPHGEWADGIVMYYSIDTMLSLSEAVDEKKASYSELSVLCCENNEGSQILIVLNDKSGAIKTNDSFIEYLNGLSNNQASDTTIKTALENNSDTTVPLRLGNENYVVVIGRASSTDIGLYVASVYKESAVYAEGFTLMETSIVTMAILLLVIVVFTFYYMISRRRIYQRIEEIDTVNPVLQCPTLVKFERDAKEIISEHRNTYFAVVISHLQHFSYVSEKYGDAATTAILRHIRSVFAQAMMEGERYGYVDDGEFVLLLHYREEASLENRLISLFDAARRHYADDGMPEDYDMKMLFGVYKTGKGSTMSIEKMVEKAMEVSDMPSRTDINRICNFYTETIRSDYMAKAEIENRMEGALDSGEFRLFYQPKYNLENDRIDGAEILVRWYNPETKNYRSPAEFLPVFEENGFISKLDRHIYYTACENISKWIAEGRRVYPVSVNISRVTAIQADFLDYYIKVKKYFNIADGFITLEFTESFAYENYEYLSNVAKQLRKAGFLCSIDDFGTGYSTFNVLKLLDMDEIKFDKFFLDKGASEVNDRIILQSVINVGKEMGLKTTQEGVETLEDLQRLREMGCRVIQGYFFAKPMSSSDYNLFIEACAKENPILAAEKAAREQAEKKENEK